jgi:hypothetical protein
MLWDSSVIEKPESWHSEGLGPVRSSKGARLKRIKKGYYNPPKGTIHVPGYNWLAVVMASLKEEASVVATQWWSSRGAAKSTFTTVRDNLLNRLFKHMPQGVVHVFDRGFAGQPWLEQLFQYQQLFILRWPMRYKLLDAKKVEKAAWRLAIGRKSLGTVTIERAGQRNSQVLHLYYTRVFHPGHPDKPLFLVVSRQGRGRKPWYLITNLDITSDQDAWNVIFAYARRWKIEQTFRFAKAEMAIQSPRLWFWKNRLKFMLILTLAIDFLLHLHAKAAKVLITTLLKYWCPRTGNRCRLSSAPIYRIRLALSQCWNYFVIQNSG